METEHGRRVVLIGLRGHVLCSESPESLEGTLAEVSQSLCVDVSDAAVEAANALAARENEFNSGDESSQCRATYATLAIFQSCFRPCKANESRDSLVKQARDCVDSLTSPGGSKPEVAQSVMALLDTTK